MFLIRKDALVITHAPQWLPVTSTCFPQAFFPLYYHWPFLTPAKLLCHSLLLPLCYNCLALTALSCVTSKNCFYYPCSLCSSQHLQFSLNRICKLWYYLSDNSLIVGLFWFNPAPWQPSCDSTALTVQHNQPGPRSLSSDTSSAAPAPAHNDTTDYPRERPHKPVQSLSTGSSATQPSERFWHKSGIQ